MELQPLTPRSARTADGRIRLYAGPMFVRPDDGNWTTIDDAVRIVRAGEKFRLQYGNQWAELGPAGRLLGLRETVAEGNHFGWRLDARQAEDAPAWALSHSPGAERVKDGIILGRPDGVPLGIFWRDWRQHKPRVSGDQLTLDVSAAKARAIREYEAAGSPQESYPLLDLDPIIATAEQARLYIYDPAPYDYTWTQAREAATATGPSATLIVQAEDYDDTRALDRTIFVFDTSLYPASAAVLYVFYDAGYSDNTPDNAGVTRVDVTTDPVAGATYGEIKADGYDQVGYYAGVLSYSSVNESQWCTRDVTSQYEPTSRFGVGLIHVRDYNDTGFDTAENGIVFGAAGASAPYLEITLASRQLATTRFGT